MKKTYIYFIRHGEVKNPDKIFYGRLPRYGLSKRGFLQIKKLALLFKSKKIDAIYSSPLLRSRLTAKAIIDNNPNLKIHYSKYLIEWGNPLWEGKSYLNRTSKMVDIYLKTPTKLKMSGVESMAEIEKRMVKFTERILEKYQGQKVVAVSHGDPIRLVRLHYEGKNLDLLHNKACTNASITTLVFEKNKLVKSLYKEIYPRDDEKFWTQTKKEVIC